MPTLSDPLALPCGVTLKNRLVKAAMTEGLGDPFNRATARHEVLYRRWAQGGAGMLLTGNIQIDRRYLERPGNVAIDGAQPPEALDTLRLFAAAATEDGTACFAQISHAGRQTPKIVAATPVGPSAVRVKLPGGQFGTPRALEEEEITDIIARFAYTAKTCQAVGFSGVQIHAAHGYLLSGFLNPITNRRTDGWGGSLEARARLLLEVIAATRQAVGVSYPVSVKLNSSDFQKGGFSFKECLQVVHWLNEAGIDLLEISGGNYEQPKLMGLEGLTGAEVVDELPALNSTELREAYFVAYTEEIAKTAQMPLMVTGGFRSHAAMDLAIKSQAVQAIGIGRPLCVRPDIPKALLDGQLDKAPAYEDALALGGGILGPKSPVKFIRVLNGFGAMAFFYQNLYRLADGLEGDEKMALFPALLRHQSGEAKMAKALK